MSDKVVYQVEMTKDESEAIERNRNVPKGHLWLPSGETHQKAKRQLTEKQKQGLELGKQKLAEKHQQKKQLKAETTELEKKKIEKEARRKLKEQQALQKLELLKKELEQESSSDEEVVIKKVKSKKQSVAKQLANELSVPKQPQSDGIQGYALNRTQPVQISQPEPIKISLKEFMRMRGF